MTIWKDGCGDDVEIPNNYVRFFEEYEALCQKHGLMVLSNGEPVVICEYHDPEKGNPWAIKTSTANEITRLNVLKLRSKALEIDRP